MKGFDKYQTKQDASTIFVRQIPSGASRTLLEDFFSQYGPVKKCSIIKPKDEAERKCLYGFVKYSNERDALSAMKQLRESRKKKTEQTTDDIFANLVVELADYKKVDKKKDSKAEKLRSPGDDNENITKNICLNHKKPVPSESSAKLSIQKRSSRVIVRNLSFRASIDHVKKALSQFGPIVEVHIPTVDVSLIEDHVSAGMKNKKQHRGFAFVTFGDDVGAKQSIIASQDKSNPIFIMDRNVAIELALPKDKHQTTQRFFDDTNLMPATENIVEEVEEHAELGAKSFDSTGNKEKPELISRVDCGTIALKSMRSVDSDESISSDIDESNHSRPVDDVQENRTIFVRNIPYDATRHDLFELFRKYGRVDSIYLVKEKTTDVCKGTAFVKFHQAIACERAIEASAAGSFKITPFNGSKTFSSEDLQNLYDEEGIVFQGRRLLVNQAVDRQVASSLTAERDEDGKVIKRAGADKRNLYLRAEGHVSPSDPNLWAMLPPIDQSKRERAWSEKKAKLRSPIFFINPYRISVRNLSSKVDKSKLKRLAVEATLQGLKSKKVTSKDISNYLLAQGRQSNNSQAMCIPEFNEKNIKEYIPSTYVCHENSNSVDNKLSGKSKGFGFIEFKFHAHALACLRELNNNTKYSAEFVAGAKPFAASVMEREPNKIPRLIVEFAVENRAKVKLQLERRAKLQTSAERLKLELDDLRDIPLLHKKKQRGKLQREKKRKIHDSTEKQLTMMSAPEEESHEASPSYVTHYQKKIKVHNNDCSPDYQKDTKNTSKAMPISLNSSSSYNEAATRTSKRWFE